MLINIKDTLLLDDNIEYVVVSKANYNGKNYYYLLDKTHTNAKFCYEKGEDSLVDVENNDLIKKLLPLFIKSTKKEMEIE